MTLQTSTQENVLQNEQKHSDICIRFYDGDHRRSRIRARGAVLLQLRQWRGNAFVARVVFYLYVYVYVVNTFRI